MASLIKIRRDSSTNWTAINPVLAIGEPGYETNTKLLKIGDGESQWSALPYSSGSLDETDPIFSASPAGSITTANINDWDTAYDWGDHASAGYLTTYNETDPVFTASAAAGITSTNITNWNTAYGWGDHSLAGYLTSFTETDPVFTASAAAGITSTNITNWNTAYGWGDHSVAGYLTSFTETDTLATVTGRGATTATAISITNNTVSTSTSTGALTVAGGVGIAGNLNVGGDKITINTPALNNGGIQLESDGSFVGRVGIGSFIASNGTSNDIGIYSQSNILFSTGAGAAERVRIDHDDSNVQVKFATGSTSTTTGALTVAGGVGIAGNLNVGGTVTLSAATNTITTSGNGQLNIRTTDRTDSFSRNILITTGSSTTSTSGDIIIATGMPAAGEQSGDISLTPSNSTQVSGNVTVRGGDSTGPAGAVGGGSLAGRGGNITIRGGDNTYTETVGQMDGGDVYITGGSISNTSSDTFAVKNPGSVYINAGTSGTGGTINAGSIYIGDATPSGTFDPIAIRIGNSLITTRIFSATNISNETASTSASTGALTVSGGAGIGENLNVGGNLVVTGDLSINGTTTTINATTITVDDKNIELGSVATPTNTTADGGGITLKGATDKTFNWVNASSAWTSSEHLNLLTGKEYKINNTTVLSSTQVLGKGFTNAAGEIVTTDGTQTLSNKTLSGSALSNISGMGFQLGVVIDEFSTDTTFIDDSDSIVPTQAAVKGYVDTAVSGVTATSVGLGNVTNESKATMFTDPTFTGDTTTAKIIVDNSYLTFTPGYGIFPSGGLATGNLLFYNDSIRYSVNGDEKFILSNDGTLTIQQTAEKLNTKTSATGTVVHNFSTGAIWYHSSISDDFTANFTNVPTTDNRSIICTLILNQGATAYVPNAVQIDGVAQTINWIGSAGVPVGDANDVNIATFVLIRQSNTWQVLGSIVNNPSSSGAVGTLQDVTTAGASTSNAVSITNATASTSTTTGALVVSGGVGISENLTVGGNIKLKSDGSTSLSVDAASFANAISLSHNTVDAYIDIGKGNLNIRTIQGSKSVIITGTTATSSSTTGALTVAGGVGIAGDLFVGGAIAGYAPLDSPSFTGTTLTAGSVLFTNQDPGNTGTDTVTAPYIEASLGIYASFFTNIFGDIAIGPSGDNTGVINFQRQAVFQQTSEVLNTKTSATGPVEHDFETGAIWYHSSISANFTANFTRVPTTDNRTISLALILVQGTTAYIPNAVQIGGAAQTILWQGGTAPTGNANKTDIVSFTLLRTGSAWTVLGSLSTYG